ncbi:MAG: DUF4867 family protein [Chloroflexi bacterium]|nr:DUF4867 family protein [Chloroflexota bacterium]
MENVLTRLQAANPNLNILPVEYPEFAKYGRLLRQYDAAEMIERALAVLPNSEKVVYEPSVPALEVHSQLNDAVEREVYGGMPVQVGWCYGQNLQMAGLEYHKGSEVNVCLTDVLLLVGDERDIVYDEGISYPTSSVAAFYARKGSVVEFHPWNLHYAPLHVRQGGSFATLVYLPRGTNYALPYSVPLVGENRLLFAVNKWLLIHPDQKDTIAQGAYPGLLGEDIFVTPV